MADMYTLFSTVVGIPQNDIQATFLYMAGACIAPLIIYYILYLFKVIGGLTRQI